MPSPDLANVRMRSMVTPEGVDLQLKVADASERAAAFLLDFAIIVAALIGMSLLLLLISALTGVKAVARLSMVVWLLGSFALRNLYFMGFELGPRAATPGKRIVGLRVAARDGGILTADAVFARNAMRELEVYLPLTFLLSSAGGVNGLIVTAGLIWSGVFTLFPVFNRDRLRAGDFVAGTWVVRAPRRRLGKELINRQAERASAFPFTTAQLDTYGVKELQVLEDVMRRNSSLVVAEVATRIRVKIGWTRQPGESDWDFIDAYYTAMRTHQETRLLFGRRRQDKYDRSA